MLQPPPPRCDGTPSSCLWPDWAPWPPRLGGHSRDRKQLLRFQAEKGSVPFLCPWPLCLPRGPPALNRPPPQPAGCS